LPSANYLTKIIRIKVAIRILLSAFFVITILFCVYGLIATLEPLPAATQWAWRGIYVLILIGNIAGLTHIIRGLFRR
jgi:hypothetical protein